MKRMRALGRRGPGLVPKRFNLLLADERARCGAWPSFLAWVDRASAGDLVAAYEASRNPWARYWMCYRVGWRGLRDALPMLVHALDDPVPIVRREAADGLGRFGDPRTGYDLFKRLAVEDDPEVRFWLLLGLGTTRYAPALPHLVEALFDDDPGTGFRHLYAMALANLGDKAALPALRRAYDEEPESDHPTFSPKAVIRESIQYLENG